MGVRCCARIHAYVRAPLEQCSMPCRVAACSVIICPQYGHDRSHMVQGDGACVDAQRLWRLSVSIAPHLWRLLTTKRLNSDLVPPLSNVANIVTVEAIENVLDGKMFENFEQNLR